MTRNIRTFIAIKITAEPELLDVIQLAKEEFETEDIKWVEENNLHLTLKFLGETSEKEVENVKMLLENIAEEFAPFSFQLNGLGYFKSKGHPKVLFVGIRQFDDLKQLVLILGKRLAVYGFEKETREFKPHLTLGRIKFLKDKSSFFHFVEKFQNQIAQRISVSEIIFYQSILKPAGPVYVPLQKVQLKHAT